MRPPPSLQQTKINQEHNGAWKKPNQSGNRPGRIKILFFFARSGADRFKKNSLEAHDATHSFDDPKPILHTRFVKYSSLQICVFLYIHITGFKLQKKNVRRKNIIKTRVFDCFLFFKKQFHSFRRRQTHRTGHPRTALRRVATRLKTLRQIRIRKTGTPKQTNRGDWDRDDKIVGCKTQNFYFFRKKVLTRWIR